VLLGLLDRVWCIFSKVVWRSKHRIRSIQLSLSFMFKHVALPFIHHKLLQFMGIASTKWKSSYDKGRKYNNNRENTFIWLKKANDGSEDVYCKLCHIAIIPRHSNFMNHEKKTKNTRTDSTNRTNCPQSHVFNNLAFFRRGSAFSQKVFGNPAANVLWVWRHYSRHGAWPMVILRFIETCWKTLALLDE